MLWAHLTAVHDPEQCNNRRFFRADHFRQHLIHSHTSARGIWLDKLVHAGRIGSMYI